MNKKKGYQWVVPHQESCQKFSYKTWRMNITRKHKIRLLARYVDDILVINDSITSNENDILNDLNSIHNKIKFIHENEINNTINYLNLTITKSLQKKIIDLEIYHKPTRTQHRENKAKLILTCILFTLF